MKTTIYHNPRCSKSRKTLELLEQNGRDTDVVRYLDNPPDRQELERILQLLGIEPRQLMRTGEAIYKENNLDNQALTREELIDAMLAHPILIERPIVIQGNRAIIGRPPEKVLDLFS